MNSLQIKKVSFDGVICLPYYRTPEAKFYVASEDLFLSSNEYFVYLEYKIDTMDSIVAVPMSNVRQIQFEPLPELEEPEPTPVEKIFKEDKKRKQKAQAN